MGMRGQFNTRVVTTSHSFQPANREEKDQLTG